MNKTYTDNQLKKMTKEELINVIKGLTIKAPNTNIPMANTGIVSDSKEFYERQNPRQITPQEPIKQAPSIKEETLLQEKSFNVVDSKDNKENEQKANINKGAEKWQ